MANEMMLPALVAAKQVFESYEVAYQAATDVSTPKRKAWNEALEAKLAETPVEVPNFAPALIEFAQESDSSLTVFALLERIDEVRATLKAYLDTHFTVENKSSTDGVLSPEELQALHTSCVKKWKALVAMIDAEYMTYEDLEGFVPTKTTKPRKVKGGGIAPGKTTWASPGRINGPRTPKGGKSINTTVQLLVNGEVAEGTTLGEQCMKSGIPGFTVRKFMDLLEANDVNFSDSKEYSSSMVTYIMNDEAWDLGLRVK